MPVRVTPDTYGNTYEFSLTGADENGDTVTIGLRPVNNKGEHSIHAVRYSGYPTATLRGETGDGQFSLKRKPYGEFSRRDWSSGIGELNSLTDAKKYWMGKGVWSVVPERMMLAPKLFRANIAFPARVGNEPSINFPVTYQSIPAGTRYAWKVTAGAASTGIDVLIRTLVPNVFMLSIKNDSAGVPGTMISQTQVSDVVLGGSRYQIELPIDAGTFWIEIYGSAAWEIGTCARTSYETLLTEDTATYTIPGAYGPVFFLMSATGAEDWVFFNYRWGTYVVSGQRLFINGDRGSCDSNVANLNTLVDATKNWTVDEWKGAIVKVNQGPHGWRKIVSNTATTLTVDRPYTTAHSATTNWYVILGSDKWTEITGHGFTADVTDAEPVREETVYSAMGPDQQCRRMREYNNSGTWTRDFDEDTQPTAGVLPGANFLCSVFDQIDGPVLYKIVNGDQGYIAKAPAVAWGTDLTFDTEIKVASDNWEDLSGAVEYDGKLAVTAMDSLWMIQNGYAEKVSIDMQSQWTGFTGRRPTVVPPYLVFPFGNRVQRMYQNIVESFGPERDSALPKRYDGQVMDNLSLVGGLAICKDGGKLGTYATDAEGGAFIYRDGGWHPLAFTGLGSSMRALWYQRREDEMDMMWFGDHNGLWYMYVPRGWDYTKDPMYEQANHIEGDGWFVTGWFDTGQLLPQKWWDFVTVFADNLSSSVGRKIRVYYQISDGVEYEVENLASSWTFAEEITSGYHNTVTLDAHGRRIRFLIMLMGDNSGTPILHGYTCNYISKDDDAESWQIAISLKDFAYDKAGTPDDIVTVKEKSDLINYWARTVRPLTMNCEWPLWDDREVQILRPGLVPIEAAPEGKENMYASLTILGMEEPVDEPTEEEIYCPLDAPVTGPYSIVMAGVVEHGDITSLVGGIPSVIRTAQHVNKTAYTINGAFYKDNAGTWEATLDDGFYYVYAIDGDGNVIAVGQHDAVVPDTPGVRTGIFETTTPTKITALKLALDVATSPLTWNFNDGAQGWVFSGTATGAVVNGKLSTAGSGEGQWDYFTPGLKAVTGATFAADYSNNGNYGFRSMIIHYTDGTQSFAGSLLPVGRNTLTVAAEHNGKEVQKLQFFDDTDPSIIHYHDNAEIAGFDTQHYKIVLSSAALENVCP